MQRREYPVKLTVNGRKIERVIIDPHFELKHSDVSDEVILALVKKLDGGQYEPDDSNDVFEYYVADQLELKGKKYKLIWLLEQNELYIGVVNAYRRK